MAKYEYPNNIQFKKTITQPDIIRIIHTLEKDWMMKPGEILWRFILDGAQREIAKKKQFEEMKKSNQGYGNG